MLTETPKGKAGIIATFGTIGPGFEARNIVSFTLPYKLLYDGNPVTKSRCHKLIVDNFVAVFTDIKNAGLEDLAKNYGGIYNNRPIRGKTNPSTHSWGIAIDLEPSKYPLGSSKRFDARIIEIFRNHGFMYGGDFSKRKDPMHFQFATNY